MAIMAEQWGGPGTYAASGPGGMTPPSGLGGMVAQWDTQGGLGMAAMHGGSGPSVPTSFSTQGNHVAMELKQLFLSLNPEEQRQHWASELIRRSSEVDAAACIPLILNRLMNFPSAHGLGIHVLGELLHVHPWVLAQHLHPNRFYDLFNPSVDDGPAGTFVHAFLCFKQQSCSVEQESGKLQRLLMRRAKTQDLRRVPFSTLRSWLCQIWLDAPSSRPDNNLLTQCCARWIGDSATSPVAKLPCLALIKSDLAARGRPEGDAWLLGLLLEQVCRDPNGHSPDLQQLLWLLGDVPSAGVLRPLLADLAEERHRLVTLWVCLCLWLPQAGPESLVPPLPAGSPPPIHGFLRMMLVAFSQFPQASELCRTCLMTVAAVAAGEGAIAATAGELLLLLHRDGPMLSSDAWLPMVPILQGLASRSAAASELLQRLGEVMGAAPQQFGTNVSAYQTNGSGNANSNGQGNWGAVGVQSTSIGAVGGYPQANGQQGPMTQQQVAPQMQQQMQQQMALQQPPALGKACYTLTPPRVGLQNIQNTCYVNSVIQSLFMTNSFVHDIYNFQRHLKKDASVVDKEDHVMGRKIVREMQRHLAKMILTRHKHTDIAQLLSVFPDIYRSGEQQDVTECIRLVFDKLGGYEQPLIRDTFAGELTENTQCQVCGNIRGRPETFTDLVLSVPSEEQVMQSRVIPTAQMLFNQRLQCEMMTDDNLLFCERCNQNTRAAKWAEITSPPRHLCICLNRFTYNVQKQDFAKEKTPIQIDETLQIGPFLYDLYMVIVHTGKDATSGHYYTIGARAEMTDVERQMGQRQWFTMDDSQLKAADMSILSGEIKPKMDDNPYVLFYRCQKAPPTPQVQIPMPLVDDVLQEDASIQIS